MNPLDVLNDPWIVINAMVQVFMYLGAIIIIAKIIYLFGKYQVFDKNPRMDEDWWRIRSKLVKDFKGEEEVK